MFARIALALTATVVLALVACGADGPPDAAEIYADAGEAMAALTSYHVTGDGHDEGVVFGIELDFVLPDSLHFRQVFQFMRLGRRHTRREAVQAVNKVIDFPDSATCPDKNPILFILQLRSDAADHCTVLVKALPCPAPRGKPGGRAAHRRDTFRSRRRHELYDVGFA